jgi:tyrosyl-tRNA synthetase
MNSLEQLQKDGIISAITSPEIDLDKNTYTFYTGFDPTADSLHVGHLFALLTMTRLQKLGHKPVALIGGATGMIGDPSGKSKERVLLDEEAIRKNSAAIGAQISRFIDRDKGGEIVNNIDWFGGFYFINFLRDVGKHFRVTEMLAKESVQKRIESEEGLSFTEFSYQLLQSYDFYHLCQNHGCNLQVGGSDQWGNITAGIDFIRKKCGKQAYGIVLPLIQSASGEKFGKSEGNCIWLDREKTSPYNFYQFWMNTEDVDVIRFLRFFSFLEPLEIERLEQSVAQNPEQREAQKTLAYAVTTLVHGEEEAQKALLASKVLFGGQISGMSDKDLYAIFPDVPSMTVDREKLNSGLSLIDTLVESGLARSKGQARTLVKQGGIYLNNIRVEEENLMLSESDLASESTMVLRSGKRKYFIIKFQ